MAKSPAAGEPLGYEVYIESAEEPPGCADRRWWGWGAKPRWPEAPGMPLRLEDCCALAMRP
ncbi:MAG: hypothetical protein ACLU9S_24605 [Oscillospiraceae bacterium]